jgi:tetratricopeptide (TPR) repeat protein
MNDPSASASGSNEELLRLFAQRYGHGLASDDGTPSQQDSARRIVAAVGPAVEAVVLAAAFADEFALALPTLADALEHPSKETLLTTPQPPTGRALIAATAVQQGQRCQDAGDLPRAEHAFRWATQQFHALGEQQAESLALTLLGRVVEMQDRLDEAAQCYQGALTIDQTFGDRFNEGVDLGLLGQVAWLQGQFGEADQLLRQALALHRRFWDRQNTASTLFTLGQVAQQRGQRWRAKLYLLRSKLAELGLL